MSIDEPPNIDPILLQRIKLSAEAIRRGEKTYTLEEVFSELHDLILEKSGARISNNNKQISQK